MTPNLVGKKMKWKPEVPLYIELQKKYELKEKGLVRQETKRRGQFKQIDSEAI